MNVKENFLEKLGAIFKALAVPSGANARKYESGEKVVIKSKPTLPAFVFEHGVTSKDRIAKLSADNKKPYANIPFDID